MSIPEGKNIKGFLDNELQQANNIKNREHRKILSMSLSKLRDGEDFTGYIFAGDDGITYIEGRPSSFRYKCGKRYYTEWCDRENSERLLVLIIDTGEATLGWSDGTVIRHEYSYIPSKHGKGGQSQNRYARVIREMTKKWYRKWAEIINQEYPDEDLILATNIISSKITDDLWNEPVEHIRNVHYHEEWGIRMVVEQL